MFFRVRMYFPSFPLYRVHTAINLSGTIVTYVVQNGYPRCDVGYEGEVEHLQSKN